MNEAAERIHNSAGELALRKRFDGWKYASEWNAATVERIRAALTETPVPRSRAKVAMAVDAILDAEAAR